MVVVEVFLFFYSCSRSKHVFNHSRRGCFGTDLESSSAPSLASSSFAEAQHDSPVLRDHDLLSWLFYTAESLVQVSELRQNTASDINYHSVVDYNVERNNIKI